MLQSFVKIDLLLPNDFIFILDSFLNLSNQEARQAVNTLTQPIKDYIFFAKGNALIQLKQRDKAKDAFKLVSSFNPTLYADTNVELGSYYLLKKDYKKALKCFESAQSSDPKGDQINVSMVEDSILSLKETLNISEVVCSTN
eukprot:TRINITY_DN12364_c0_g1_i1.p1 TRINITY_DN12364_c0_g1~~TRINITY_DN12364_c0_g1_i1.p1  ORF type:complete len:142 (+),score=23.84 TRINITY_DN12364_c0_g1_i1:41-466(+)